MLAVVGVAALVSGLASQDPVKVISCKVAPPYAYNEGGPDSAREVNGNYAIRVKFLDTADQPLKRVLFETNTGRRVVDVGTFSPGVIINHTLPLGPTRSRACSVSSATLADGTKWRMPVAARYL